MFKPALALMTVLALGACSEPWFQPGSVLVQVPTPSSHMGSAMASMSSGKYGENVLTSAPHPRGPVTDNPVQYTGPGGKRIEREDLHPGRHIVYKDVGECTTPNTAYAMHHMAGKYECAVLYDQAAYSHASNGYRQVIFRDWLGRAYAPDANGVWVPATNYDRMTGSSGHGDNR